MAENMVVYLKAKNELKTMQGRLGSAVQYISREKVLLRYEGECFPFDINVITVYGRT